MIITTNHCLNCILAGREQCPDYVRLQSHLFEMGIELDERIDEYKRLAAEKGCEV